MAYTYEISPIANFQTNVDAATNKQFVTAENLTKIQTVNLNVSVPLQITAWWGSQNNFIVTGQQVNAIYQNAPLQFSKMNFNIYSSQNITLSKFLSAELSGFYQSAGLFGTAKFKGLGALNVGLQKSLKKNNAKLRFSIDDVFASIKYRTSVDMPDQHFLTRSEYNFSQRTFKLTYSRNFGNSSLKDKRDRSTGSEEELQRVK